MFAITSAVAATLLLTQPHHATISAEKQENKQQLSASQDTEIRIPFKETDASPIINESETANIQESPGNPQPSDPETKLEVNMAMISPRSLMPADSPVKKKITITSTNGKTTVVSSSSSPSNSSVTVISGSGNVSAFSSHNGDSSEVIIDNGNGSTNIIRHSKTQSGTNCKCNFGDDDDWIDDAVKELKKQNLISDECNYKFKLSSHSLVVNGKEITDQDVISKIKTLYESSTDNHLRNDDDYISVKVTQSSCDLSKSINDK